MNKDLGVTPGSPRLGLLRKPHIPRSSGFPTHLYRWFSQPLSLPFSVSLS